MKKDLEKRIKDLEAEIGRTKFYLERVDGRLNALIEELAKQEEKKPRLYFKSGNSTEIMRYWKFSDDHIEFSIGDGCTYEFISWVEYVNFSDITGKVVYPMANRQYMFRRVSDSSYASINNFDRIEILDGVDEYDIGA